MLHRPSPRSNPAQLSYAGGMSRSKFKRHHDVAVRSSARSMHASCMVHTGTRPLEELMICTPNNPETFSTRRFDGGSIFSALASDGLHTPRGRVSIPVQKVGPKFATRHTQRFHAQRKPISLAPFVLGTTRVCILRHSR